MAKFEALCAEVFENWNAIQWHRIIIGGYHDESSLPEAREALAEDVVGGGLLRVGGPGTRAYIRKQRMNTHTCRLNPPIVGSTDRLLFPLAVCVFACTCLRTWVLGCVLVCTPVFVCMAVFTCSHACLGHRDCARVVLCAVLECA